MGRKVRKTLNIDGAKLKRVQRDPSRHTATLKCDAILRL